MKQIKRFELITPEGREKVIYEDLEYEIQDNDQTLKVFVKKV